MIRVKMFGGVFSVSACLMMAARAVPLVNASFETHPTGTGLSDVTLSGGSAQIPGWAITGASVDWISTLWPAANGIASIDMDGLAPGGLTQAIATDIGATYQITFSLAGNPDSSSEPIKKLRVTAAGVTTNYTFDVTGHTRTSMGWVGKSMTFMATATSTTLNFMSVDTVVTGRGPALDAIAVTNVAGLPSVWNVDSSDSWNLAGNWTNGVPDGVGQIAQFGNKITSPRTITVGSPVTVGTIQFDNSSAYTVSGAGAISLDVSAGQTAIPVLAGSHTISAPLSFLDDLAVTVAPLAGTLTLSNLQSSTRVIIKDGPGRLSVNNVRSGGLAVNGGSVKVTPSGGNGSTSILGTTPTFGASGKLDLTNNDLIIRHTGSSAAVQIRGLIASGYQGGGWDGATGITSSTAGGQPDGATGLGYADAKDVYGMGATDTATFDGQSVAGSDALVKYTWLGDSDFSGDVDQTSDLTLFIIGLNSGGSTWYEGDYDYNGVVDQTGDLTLFIIGLNSQSGMLGGAGGGPMLGAVIPEPTLLSLGALAVGVLPSRLRRRR